MNKKSASKLIDRKRYGRRATGKTQTTISLSEEALAKVKAAAEADGRTLSNFIERLIMTGGKIGLIVFGLQCFMPH